MITNKRWHDFCFYTSDNGGGEDQGGGAPPQKPPWADEFGETFDPNRAWTTIKAQRDAEKELKKSLEQTQGKLKEIEDSQKTELEKAQARVKELEEENAAHKQRETESKLRQQVADAAKAQGALYPEDIYALVSDRLDVSDEGKIKGLDKVIQDLKASRPAMFNTQNIDQSNRNNNGAPPNGDMNSMIRRSAGRGG